MFDSHAVLQSWGIIRLQEAADRYRGIVEIQDVRVFMDIDEGDGYDHSSIDHICQSDCEYPRSAIIVEGVGIRSSGSSVRLSVEIDADDFSFASFLDEIQEIAES